MVGKNINFIKLPKCIQIGFCVMKLRIRNDWMKSVLEGTGNRTICDICTNDLQCTHVI